MSRPIAVLAFVVAVVVANLTVAHFGPWFAPINAFLLIGLDLSLRDWLHDAWRHQIWKVGLLIASAGLVSWLLNPASGRIAVASVTAFVVAALADAATYHRFIDSRWVVRANVSNLAGAAVDSTLFPLLAFGVFPGLLPVIALQFVAKVAGGGVWSGVLSMWRSGAAASRQSA